MRSIMPKFPHLVKTRLAASLKTHCKSNRTCTVYSLIFKALSVISEAMGYCLVVGLGHIQCLVCSNKFNSMAMAPA